jgi:hypothetical protein
MTEKIFGTLNAITAACQDEKGNYIGIPLMGKIKLIDGELYTYVDRFFDGFGNEVDIETTNFIIKKFHSQIN